MNEMDEERIVSHMDEIPVGDEQLPDEDEEEDDDNSEAEIEECIAQLEATYGTDREPIATAIYYLTSYLNSLAYERERNGQ